MTYQGERARPMATENGRIFEVSKVRVGPDGHASEVLWVEVDARSSRVVGAPYLATAAEVVDAIHDGAQVTAVFSAKDRHQTRPFVVVEHQDGRECIAFEGEPSAGRNLTDLDRLDAAVPGQARASNGRRTDRASRCPADCGGSQHAGGGAWESNPSGSAWRHPPGLKPGRPTRIVAPPLDSGLAQVVISRALMA